MGHTGWFPSASRARKRAVQTVGAREVFVRPMKCLAPGARSGRGRRLCGGLRGWIYRDQRAAPRRVSLSRCVIRSWQPRRPNRAASLPRRRVHQRWDVVSRARRSRSRGRERAKEVGGRLGDLRASRGVDDERAAVRAAHDDERVGVTSRLVLGFARGRGRQRTERSVRIGDTGGREDNSSSRERARGDGDGKTRPLGTYRRVVVGGFHRNDVHARRSAHARARGFPRAHESARGPAASPLQALQRKRVFSRESS